LGLYAPFGDEVTAPTNDGTTLRFTGKGRETMGDGTANGLDYFGARYYFRPPLIFHLNRNTEARSGSNGLAEPTFSISA